MKLRKLIFLSLVLIAACTEEDNSTENNPCEIQIWGMNLSQGRYTIEYGKNENETTTIEVDEYTYNYYTAITEDSDPDDCWEGVK